MMVNKSLSRSSDLNLVESKYFDFYALEVNSRATKIFKNTDLILTTLDPKINDVYKNIYINLLFAAILEASHEFEASIELDIYDLGKKFLNERFK